MVHRETFETGQPQTISEADIAAPPVAMIEDSKILANSQDVPNQSLLKAFLAERLALERTHC